MTKEYISRDTAIESVTADNLLAHFDSVEDMIENRFHRAAERILASIPPADVVDVVRCRECKYRAEDDFCTGRGWPDQLVADDGFCDKGKRKDGGHDE